MCLWNTDALDGNKNLIKGKNVMFLIFTLLYSKEYVMSMSCE